MLVVVKVRSKPREWNVIIVRHLSLKKVGCKIDGSRQLAKLERGCIGIGVASYVQLASKRDACPNLLPRLKPILFMVVYSSMKALRCLQESFVSFRFSTIKK